MWDLASDDIPPEVEPESMDVLVLIFVLSALHPDKWDQAMSNLFKVSYCFFFWDLGIPPSLF